MHHSDILPSKVRSGIESQESLPFEAQYQQKSKESHDGHLDIVSGTHGYLWHVLKIHRTQTREEIQWHKYARDRCQCLNRIVDQVTVENHVEINQGSNDVRVGVDRIVQLNDMIKEPSEVFVDVII